MNVLAVSPVAKKQALGCRSFNVSGEIGYIVRHTQGLVRIRL
ncbi:MAG: hypothetical protein RIS47_1415 [Bacteroidota bacterium]